MFPRFLFLGTGFLALCGMVGTPHELQARPPMRSGGVHFNPALMSMPSAFAMPNLHFSQPGFGTFNHPFGQFNLSPFHSPFRQFNFAPSQSLSQTQLSRSIRVEPSTGSQFLPANVNALDRRFSSFERGIATDRIFDRRFESGSIPQGFTGFAPTAGSRFMTPGFTGATPGSAAQFLFTSFGNLNFPARSPATQPGFGGFDPTLGPRFMQSGGF